jgi:ABC-2 type transport system ATP-binding protein
VNSPTIVSVDGVSKRFIVNSQKSFKERVLNARAGRKHKQDFWALRDINLEIETGSTVGLVGHNGSGKSTLLKVIGGIIGPTTGTVKRRGRMAALLELGAGFHPDLTGRENVFLNASILGLKTSEIERHFDAIVDFSGVEDFIDTQVKFYSSGMYVRLAFAIAVHVDPDLLLVDEVLAVGDEPFQAKCMAKISEFQKEGRTIVLVSHSAPQIQQLCNRVVVLDHGIMLFDGPAREGLRVLQAGYSQELNRVRLSALSDVPEFDVRVTGVEVGSGTQPYDPSTVYGDSLSATINFEVGDTLHPLVVNFAIANALGDVLFAINSAQLKFDVPRELGKNSVTISMDQVPFGSGQLTALASVGAVNGAFIDAEFPGVSFLVEEKLPGTGGVRMPARMSINSSL